MNAEQLVGQTLGNVKLIRVLGKGGMAVVYEGLQTSLHRRVAVKILPQSMLMDEEWVLRFKREATAVAKLNHPHIVHIYDIGEDKDIHYFTMEYIEGMTIKDIVTKDGAMDPAKAVKILMQVTDGLENAHQEGVIHRDIKTSNIMLDKKGNARLTDFGLARAHGEIGLTGQGQVLGTPPYMSPEQCKGLDVDHRSDLYSLGIVAFEMLAGKLPFVANDPPSLLFKHVHEPPPDLVSPRGLMPLELKGIIDRLLAKAPEARYASAADLLAAFKALGELKEEEDSGDTLLDVTQTENLQGSSKSKKIALKIGLPVGVAAAFLAVLLLRGPSIADEAQKALDSGNVSHALDLCEKGLAKKPKDPSLQVVYGTSSLLKGQVESAEKAFQSVMDSKASENLLSSAKSSLVLVYLAQGKTTEASQLCGGSSEAQSLACALLDAEILSADGKWQDAFKALEARATDPKTSVWEQRLIHQQLATLADASGQVEVSLNARKKLMNLGEGSSSDQMGLALSMEKAGQTQQALGMYQTLSNDKAVGKGASLLAARAERKLAWGQSPEDRERIGQLIKDLSARMESIKNGQAPAQTPAKARRGLILQPIEGTMGAFDDPSWLSVVDEGTRSSLVRSGRVNLVEREQLSALLEEQNLSSSALADPEQGLMLGKVMSAHWLVTPKVSRMGKEIQISLKGVEVETTRIAFLENFRFSTKASSADVGEKMGDFLSLKLREAAPLSGKVIGVQDQSVQLELGQSQGVEKGDLYAPVVEGMVLADGACKVVEVQADACRLEVPQPWQGKLGEGAELREIVPAQETDKGAVANVSQT